MICCRCQKGIKPGQAYNVHVHDRASAGPLVNYSHKDGCKRR